ncbi:DUF726 domain-containing protein [Haloarcula rubripromontorii]|uniref:DUF726 domain-containing protein n=1 Tax=Haloarcula rubripromontorii TaxID=1705562 RepID=UPI000A686285|nr:DUF726 domain-containing protein [Haloarcula rubripromontorii]
MFQRSIQWSELDGQTRRSFLKASTGAVASVATLGASGSVRGGKYGGDDGEYTAPAGFPLVSTREQFTDNAKLKSEYTETEYETVGDWESSQGGDDSELVIFVHGWSLGETDARNAAYTCQIGLEKNEYDQFTVGFTWDADKGDGIGWNEGVAIAEQNGPKLAQWVIDHNDGGGLPVRIIGHSLGAKVAVEAMASLHERGREDAVTSVTLLGGAIGESVVEVDEAYGEPIEYATTSFNNFHKDDDAVLGIAFSAAEWTEAVGEKGVQSPEDAPENYTDYDVTTTVADHNSYYEPGEGCLPAVVETFQ